MSPKTMTSPTPSTMPAAATYEENPDIRTRRSLLQERMQIIWYDLFRLLGRQ
jgi:hypothetical protein